MAREHRFSAGAALVGLLCIGIGLLFILEVAGSLVVQPEILWPAAIIGLGVALVVEAVVRHAERP